MTERKPFLEMPCPDFGLYSGYTHKDEVVRELREKYEARIAEVLQENSDLAEAGELLVARAEKAEARIRELEKELEFAWDDGNDPLAARVKELEVELAACRNAEVSSG